MDPEVEPTLIDLLDGDDFGQGEKAPEPELEASKAEVTPEDGDPSPQEKTDAPKPEGEAKPELPKWAVEEVAKQRAKRRDAETRAQQIEVQLAELKGMMQAQGQNQPADVDEDAEWYGDVKQSVRKEVQTVKQEVASEVNRMLLDHAISEAQSQWPDYMDKQAQVVDAARTDPALAHKLETLPALQVPKFVYEQAKLMEQTKGHGSLEDLLKAEREKAKQELLEELKRKKAKSLSSVPETTAGARAGHTLAHSEDDGEEFSLDSVSKDSPFI